MQIPLAITVVLSLILFAIILAPLLRKKQWLQVIGTFVFLVSITSIGYTQWGTGRPLLTWLTQGKQTYTLRQQLNQISPEFLIQQLQQQVKNHPDDTKAWYLLGRLYQIQQQPEKAEQAFAHVPKPQ